MGDFPFGAFVEVRYILTVTSGELSFIFIIGQRVWFDKR